MSKDYILTDIAISMGIDCKPAHYLRKNCLRISSYPLDWMMRYSLESVVELFRKDFCDFFLETEDYPQKAQHGLRYVEDTKNKIVSSHNFPLDRDIDEVYKEFTETMIKRYTRLKQYMLSAEHILFVSGRPDPIENYEKFLLDMNQMFKCKMTYLNIKYNPTEELLKKELNSNLNIIQYSFKDTYPDSEEANGEEWTGNYIKWDEIMKTIKLTNKFSLSNRQSVNVYNFT